jgi:hypothetical protein
MRRGNARAAFKNVIGFWDSLSPVRRRGVFFMSEGMRDARCGIHSSLLTFHYLYVKPRIMRTLSFLVILTTALTLQGQLPIRNYIFLNQDSIVSLLGAEGLEFEVYADAYFEDSYGYDYDLEEEQVYYEDYGAEESGIKEEEIALTAPDAEVVGEEEAPGEPATETSIEVYSSEQFGFTDNSASFYLRNDSCYLIQYDWFVEEEFVLESLRQVMEEREDFAPCPDMKDCWVQERPGEASRYYWNLFTRYEDDAFWKALRIEAEADFEANRWWYQFSEGKY